MTTEPLDLYALRDRLIEDRDKALASDRSRLPDILSNLRKVTNACLQMEIIAARVGEHHA